MVELDGTAEEQATALAIVLRASRIDNRLYAALYDDDKLDLLHTVLASSKCLVSHHLLKVTDLQYSPLQVTRLNICAGRCI